MKVTIDSEIVGKTEAKLNIKDSGEIDGNFKNENGEIKLR